MPVSEGASPMYAVRALVYEERPEDGTPFCGEFWLAAVPAIGTSITIMKGGAAPATGGRIVDVSFHGVPVDRSGSTAPIAVTFKRHG